MATTAKKMTDAPESADSTDVAQVSFNEANTKGYFGTVPDGTPNENYTLAGVTSGAPTPENQRGK